MLQVNLEDLGVVRFTSVPRSGAPPSIREQWIGVEVPCLFSHSLAPPPRSQPPTPSGTSGSPGRVLGQSAIPLSPSGEEEVVVALHLLQGCCLADTSCKEQAANPVRADNHASSSRNICW